MEVVLLKDVRGLGAAGEIKSVADGYARNYLIPRKLAVIASAAARKQAEERLAAQAKRAEAERAEAQKVAEAHQNIEIVFTARAGETGRLYGSITSGDIAERLSQELGEEVDRRRVELDEPIKELGTFDVTVRLHPGVTMTVQVTVRSEDTEEEAV